MKKQKAQTQVGAQKKLGFFSSFGLVALLVALAIGFCSWLYWEDRTQWPVFPSEVHSAAGAQAAASSAPEVEAVLERDYGWRIGDIVPVTIYLKQKPGTVVDLHSIALAGDFELVGEPDLFESSRPDGSKVYRVKVKLQSFSVAPQLNLKANISYRVLATNDDVTVDLPTVAPYTSKTWDGRKLIQEGKLDTVQGMHGWITLAYLLVGVFGTFYFWRLSRHFYNLIPVPVRPRVGPSRFIKARKQFDAVWAKMEAGDRSRANYTELSRIIRALYNIETKTALEAKYWYLYGHNGPSEIADMLMECDKVIYQNRVLEDEEHYRIKNIFDSLVAPAHVSLPSTAENAASQSEQ